MFFYLIAWNDFRFTLALFYIWALAFPYRFDFILKFSTVFLFASHLAVTLPSFISPQSYGISDSTPPPHPTHPRSFHGGALHIFENLTIHSIPKLQKDVCGGYFSLIVLGFHKDLFNFETSCLSLGKFSSFFFNDIFFPICFILFCFVFSDSDFN